MKKLLTLLFVFFAANAFGQAGGLAPNGSVTAPGMSWGTAPGDGWFINSSGDYQYGISGYPIFGLNGTNTPDSITHGSFSVNLLGANSINMAGYVLSPSQMNALVNNTLPYDVSNAASNAISTFAATLGTAAYQNNTTFSFGTGYSSSSFTAGTAIPANTIVGFLNGKAIVPTTSNSYGGVAVNAVASGATVQIVRNSNLVPILFDGAAVIDDIVIPSTITPGQVHDSGLTGPTALAQISSTTPIVGVVQSTVAAGGGIGIVRTHPIGTYGALFTCPTGDVCPENYGAAGNGFTGVDGTVTASNLTASSSGSSTTPATPSVTTATAQDYVVSIFGIGSAWSTQPTGTAILTDTWASGSYGMLAIGQVAATAGATTALSGTTSASAFWEAMSIPLAPSVAGTPPTFVAATQATSTSSTSLTFTLPTSAVAGDYEIACGEFYYATFNTYLRTGPTWLPLSYKNNSGNNLNCYGKFVAANEPTSYTFTRFVPASTSGMANGIMDFRGTSGPDGASNVLTSASANFNSGSVGNPICIGSTTALTGFTYSSPEACGTITAYTSATSVKTSIPLISSLTNAAFIYGSDDSTAFQTMLTTAPCSTTGCTAWFSAKTYIKTKPLVMGPNLNIHINGTGLGVLNTANSYLNGNTQPNFKGGSVIADLGPGSGAGLTIGGTLHVTGTASQESVQNVAFQAGVGVAMDGSNTSDGIDILNMQNVLVSNVGITNYGGCGIYVDGMAAGNYKDYIEDVNIPYNYVAFNGGCGLKIGSTLGVSNLETINFPFTIFEANGGPGVWNAGANIQGMDGTGVLMQWDNRILGSFPEMYTSGAVDGGWVPAMYIEADSNFGSSSNSFAGNTAGMLGIRGMDMDHVQPPSAYTPLSFSAAGTPIPTASTTTNTNHKPANVTDSMACVNGTTYTSGGSTKCTLFSSAGVWVESGAALF